MSLGPYEYEGLGEPDPTEAVMDPDDEAERGDVSEATDYINPGDPSGDLEGSVYETSWVPPDRPPQHGDWGTTLAEEKAGEPLDQRLAEEEPDVLAEIGAELDGQADADAAAATDVDEDPEIELALAEAGGDTDLPAPVSAEQEARAGRLVAEDEGAHAHLEKDLVARDVGIDGAAASAEEAAMHIVDEP